MRPVKFNEQNIVWAENQPPYLPLPAHTTENETISCWSLTVRERLKILFTGRLWLRQMNHGQPLQPQLVTVDTPFAKDDTITTYTFEI